MTTEKFISILTHNWKQKLICLSLALLLFLYNLNRNWGINAASFKVSLKVRESDMEIAAPYDPIVVFKVHGAEKDLKNLTAADFDAYVDTSYVTENGTYDFPILLNLSDAALKIDPLEIKVSPVSIRLSLENRVSGFIDVEPLYGGVPAFGYEVSGVSVSPGQIEVHGAKSQVEASAALSAQTESISVDGAKASVEKKVKVTKPNIHLQSDDDEVTVTVKVTPIKTSKTFERIPVTLVNVSPDLELVSQTEYVSLTFDGNLEDLENYKVSANLVTVDCSSIASGGKYNLRMTVNAPRGFSESRLNQKTVSVVFNDREIVDENIKER